VASGVLANGQLEDHFKNKTKEPICIAALPSIHPFYIADLLNSSPKWLPTVFAESRKNWQIYRVTQTPRSLQKQQMDLIFHICMPPSRAPQIPHMKVEHT
jgi:hypothetical protein